jgi:hypothetical protein
MTRKHSFQCGTCNLVEENISAEEVLDLSGYHYQGKHIDVFDLRKMKKKAKERRK